MDEILIYDMLISIKIKAKQNSIELIASTYPASTKAEEKADKVLQPT